MKRALTILLFFVAVSAFGAYPNWRFSDYPYWRIDNGQWKFQSGTTTGLRLQYLMGDSGSNTVRTLDTSGNNYTGTVSGATYTYATNGLIHHYAFDGDNDNILVPTAVRPQDFNTSFSFWMINNTITANDKILSQVGGDDYLALTFSATNVLRYDEYDDGESEHRYTDIAASPVGEWHHYHYYVSATNSQCYVDGVLRTNNIASLGTFSPSLGLRLGGTSSALDGRLYNFKVWTNTAFTAAQILSTNIQQAAQLGILSDYLADNLTAYSNCVLNISGALQDGSKTKAAITTASAPTRVVVKPVSTQNPKGVGAWDFNGSANFVRVSEPNSLRMAGTFPDDYAYTISTWVNFDATNVVYCLYGNFGGGSSFPEMELLYDGQYTRRLEIRNYQFNNGTYRGRAASYVFLPSTWYHLAITYAGNGGSTNTAWKIYVNAVQSDDGDTSAGTYQGILAGTNMFNIGNRGSAGLSLDGRMGEFAVYRQHAMTPAAITNLYNSQTNLYF